MHAGTEDVEDFNPYDVGHESDTDEEDGYDETDHQGGGERVADEEQQAKGGSGGFGLGRVSTSGFKSLDLGNRPGKRKKSATYA